MVCREVLPCYKGACAECTMTAVLAWAVVEANCAAPVDKGSQGSCSTWFQLNEKFSGGWEDGYSCHLRAGRGRRGSTLGVGSAWGLSDVLYAYLYLFCLQICSLERFRSLQDKLVLLDEAVAGHDGNVITAVSPDGHI